MQQRTNMHHMQPAPRYPGSPGFQPGMSSTPHPGLQPVHVPQQSLLSDYDIQRVALAVKNLMSAEIQVKVEASVIYKSEHIIFELVYRP